MSYSGALQILRWLIEAMPNFMAVANGDPFNDVYVAVVEYKIGDMGFIRYYLAPKIEDGEDAS